MHTKTTMVLGLLLAISAMPMANAGHQPNGNCINQEAVHTYDGGLSAFATYIDPIYGNKKTIRVLVKPIVGDGCETSTGTYDGETEHGIGGGRFPAGTAGEHCDWVATSHHAYGEGAQYWANDESGFASVAYFAGADGPAIVQVTGCETDGIITDNYWTDPMDCGSGDIGVYAPGLKWTPATLRTNWYPNACDPFDGFVWVFTAYGVDTVCGFVSTPIVGHIWSS